MILPIPKILLGQYWKQHDPLANRWAKLMTRNNAKTYWFGKDRTNIFRKIFSEYSNRTRKYHNITHVSDCLVEFDFAKQAITLPFADEMETAIFYHDLIYNPKDKTGNELKSAQRAKSELTYLELSEQFNNKVYQLILATDHFHNSPTALEEQLIGDMDLAILGKSEKVFQQYERNIRREYSFVSDKDFKNGRTQALKYFHSQKTIFYTELFQNKYEAQARINLEKAIQKLN